MACGGFLTTSLLSKLGMNRINASRFNKSVRAIYNMSDRVVSAYSIVCTSDTTQTRMACETLEFYRSICEVIFKIQLM